jgi:hypothetical protein
MCQKRHSYDTFDQHDAAPRKHEHGAARHSLGLELRDVDLGYQEQAGAFISGVFHVLL